MQLGMRVRTAGVGKSDMGYISGLVIMQPGMRFTIAGIGASDIVGASGLALAQAWATHLRSTSQVWRQRSSTRVAPCPDWPL